jgi:hypothetical protein
VSEKQAADKETDCLDERENSGKIDARYRMRMLDLDEIRRRPDGVRNGGKVWEGA